MNPQINRSQKSGSQRGAEGLRWLAAGLLAGAGVISTLGSVAMAQSTPSFTSQSSSSSGVGNAAAGAGTAQADGAAGGANPAGVNSGNAGNTNAARYVQACQDALRSGQTGLGCSGDLFNNELRQLETQALQTRNPALLTLVGEVYRNEKMPVTDMGQAYRWYLMAAVRGDAMAMERLSQMYQRGSGVPADPVKALGYARLTQQFAQQSRRGGGDIARTIQRLGSEMAVEEVALSERFAQEMEARISQGKATGSVSLSAPAASKSSIPGAGGAFGAPANATSSGSGTGSAPAQLIRIPGLGQQQAEDAPVQEEAARPEQPAQPATQQD